MWFCFAVDLVGLLVIYLLLSLFPSSQRKKPTLCVNAAFYATLCGGLEAFPSLCRTPAMFDAASSVQKRREINGLGLVHASPAKWWTLHDNPAASTKECGLKEAAAINI